MEDKNALDEIHKGACMAIDAISILLPKINNKSIKKQVKKIEKDYNKIRSEIEDVYKKYNDNKPKETSIPNKMMTWYGMEIRLIKDSSDSKIVELLLQGTNMGIIEGRKILNQKKLNKNVSKLVEKYIFKQEENVEVLKDYL